MLDDTVCIVAGAGRGIGRAVAVELGSHGATVVVNDLGTSLTGEGADEEPARETIRAVRDAGGEGMAHFGDVTAPGYTEALVEDTVAEYGRVDAVANFAGMLRDDLVYKMDVDDWDAVIELHLRGHFTLLRSAAAHWREMAREQDDHLETQRSFLGTTSRAALGNVGQANYAAAKAGVMGLTRTAARELGRYNIRVNALMPTAFTRMVEQVPEEHRGFDESEMPPEKVAPMVAYLVSEAAEGITGCAIRAAGDAIGVVSDPEITHLGYREGGWTLDSIAERFREEVADGVDLDRSGERF
jgi:NAD(P)-dependent dehydrogenase (short-subunit alcohol dehydrogenase family)